MQNLTGQTIDRYHILEQIGEGGMAVVYKAYDTRLEREVAVKIIRKEAFPAEAHSRIFKRFEREAKTLALLSHPNIIKYLDYGEYDGAPYLVTEYHPSGTLKAMLGKPIPWNDSARLLLPIARALGYAHGKGILHRDVKPSNILIAGNGEPMLTDFGIAKLLEMDESQTLTGTGLGVGTPEYMAPEQGLGKEVDGRADIYSLGVVIYEIVTGSKPYTADTPLAVLFKHMTDPLPRPAEVLPGIPEDLERVILKALAKDPANRFQSMEELAAAMDKISDQSIRRSTREVISSNPELTVNEDETIDDIQPVNTKVVGSRSVEQKRTHVQEIIASEERTQPGRKYLWWQFALGGAILICLTACLLISPFLYQWIKAEKGVSNPDNNISKISELPEAMKISTPEPTSTPPPPTTPPTPTCTTPPESTNTSPPPTQTPAISLGIGSTQVSPVDGMIMVYVPAGDFKMGSNDGDKDEKPVHTVFLDAFWIDQTEVTNEMFSAFVSDMNYQTHAEKEGGSWVSWEMVYGANWQHPLGPNSNLDGLNGHPVVHVSWNDAQAYCAWAGRELPTEAQWEKAARGEDGRTYPWGEVRPVGNLVNFADKNTNFDWSDRTIDDGYKYTAPVGNYPDGASPYGALDMAGNIWEWVADFYGETYYERSPSDNPTGPDSGNFRVLRGGSWNYSSNNIRSTFRDWVDQSESYSNNGFRCVLSARVSP